MIKHKYDTRKINMNIFIFFPPPSKKKRFSCYKGWIPLNLHQSKSVNKLHYY